MTWERLGVTRPSQRALEASGEDVDAGVGLGRAVDQQECSPRPGISRLESAECRVNVEPVVGIATPDAEGRRPSRGAGYTRELG